MVGPPSARNCNPCETTTGSGRWHAAQFQRQQSTDGVDVEVVLELDVVQLADVFDGQTCRHPVLVDPNSSMGATSSVSYSSAISPTISSGHPSMVTGPAMAPYSSTSNAMWLRSRCISRTGRRAASEVGHETRRTA